MSSLSVLLDDEFRSPWLRYGVALGSLTVVLTVATLLRPVIEPSVFSLFFVAVILSAWYGGAGPGLLVTFAAAALIETFFAPEPPHSRYLHGYLQVTVFTFVSCLITSLTAARSRAEEALKRAHDNLEERVQDRTAELADANDKLHVEIAERERAVAENRRILCDLAERVKELTALQRVAHLLRDESQPVAPLLEQVARIMQAALQQPELAAVSAQFDDAAFSTGKIPDDLRLRYELQFAAPSGKRGAITIAYPDETQAENGNSFSAEEIRLVHSLSEMLQSYFERREAALNVARVSAELATSNRELWRLQGEIKRVEPLAALGQVTGTIAHELGTPLNSVLGYAQLLEQDGLPENARKRLDIIKTQVLRMTEIIDHYLTQVRRPLEKHERIDMNALIEDTLITLKPIFQQHGITVVKQLAPSLPVLQGDAASLERVLINLLDNAIDAIGTDGSIAVQTEERRLTPVGSAAVFVSISDTGKGIPLDVLPQVFEMFVTTKAPGAGSGLGLAISREIIKAHGGSLELTNTPGKGASARILLPGRQECQQAGTASETA